MSLENLKEIISKQIESENYKERGEILYEKIEQISLVYADKKFHEIKKDRPEYKFSEAVKDFTPIEKHILKIIYDIENHDLKDYDLFLKSFYEELDFLYESDGLDINKILNLIKSKKDLLKSFLSSGNFKKREDNKKEGTKLLYFNTLGIDDHKEAYRGMKKLGFSESDLFLEIHLDSFYHTNEKNFGSEMIKKDLGIIAEKIIDNIPKTAAVVGTSWLLDTPIMNRLGFIKIEDSDVEQNDNSTWNQFIDKDGQINDKRFNEFMETGELPFKSIRAYIPVEEFLKRYLPDNRRGEKIILKEVDKSKEDHFLRMKKESKRIKSDWEYLIKNNGDFKSFFNGDIFRELLGFLGQENEGKYLDFFREMYEKKILWQDFNKYQNEDLKRISEESEKKMRDYIYKTKEIIID